MFTLAERDFGLMAKDLGGETGFWVSHPLFSPPGASRPALWVCSHFHPVILGVESFTGNCKAGALGRRGTKVPVGLFRV